MPSRLRIALLTHEPFYPPSGGGSAEANYLVAELWRRGHEVQVFCPRVADRAATEAKFGVTLREFTTFEMGRYTSLRSAKYLAYPFFLKRLVAREARRKPYDVIVSQHAISAVAAGWLKRELKCPVVMNSLDFLTAFMETWPRYLAPLFLLDRLKRFEVSLPKRYGADGVMTVSDPLADYYAETGYPLERILPIYYGYDAAAFPFIEPPVAAEQSPVVVMHGSFDHHHLGKIAEDAVVEVSSQMPAAQFRFIGRRTDAVEQFFQRVQRRAPGAALECTGFVPYAEVHARMRDAAVGLTPYEESTGVHCAFIAKSVEYLGQGLAVASTPTKAIRRYFHDEPMIRFSEFDGPSLARTVLSWLREPPGTRQKHARPASDRVRRELDWQVICRKACDFVERCAGSWTKGVD